MQTRRANYTTVVEERKNERCSRLGRCHQTNSKKMKRQKKMVDNDIPEEIIMYEILSRLSAKCLLTCIRFVSHSWAHVIRYDSAFIDKHLSLANAIPDCLLVQNKFPPFGNARFLEIKEDRRRVPGHLLSTPWLSRKVVACCDGLLLLCLHEDQRVVYVANPITMQILLFDPPDLLPPFVYDLHYQKLGDHFCQVAMFGMDHEIRIWDFAHGSWIHFTELDLGFIPPPGKPRALMQSAGLLRNWELVFSQDVIIDGKPASHWFCFNRKSKKYRSLNSIIIRND